MTARIAGLALALLAAACAPSDPGRDVAYDVVWAPLETGVETGLRGLSVVDADTAWAGGDGGVALRTIDGGVSWTVMSPPQAEGAALRSVHAFSADHALYVTAGQPARILRTLDGGASFDIVHEDPEETAFYDSLVFWDENRGIAFSDPVAGAFRIILTSDAGESWRAVSPADLPPPLEGEAGFAASGAMITVRPDGRVWIGTGGAARARILAGTDFGAAWEVFDTPLSAGAPSRGVFGLGQGSGRLIAVGGDYLEEDDADAVLAVSDDNGASWRLVAGPRGLRESVQPLPGSDARVWLTVGPNGAELSQDGGDAWSPAGEAGYHALQFADDGETGYAVGGEGAAARLRVLRR